MVPEKADQVQAILTDLGVTFHVREDEERIFFRADSQGKQILVGLKCLARLWIHAFSHFTIFSDLVALKERAPDATLDLRSTDRLRKAAHLLKWAVKADMQVRMTTYRGMTAALSLPPEVESVFSEKAFVLHKKHADNHAFAALAFILYHELSHIRLNHVSEKGLASPEQEKIADREAAEWMLDSDQLSDNDRLKRRLGIAIGLGWLISLNVYIGRPENSTHPPAWDRLYQVLDQYIENDNDMAWVFTAAMLNTHLVNQRKSEVDCSLEFESAKDMVNYYLDVISRIKA